MCEHSRFTPAQLADTLLAGTRLFLLLCLPPRCLTFDLAFGGQFAAVAAASHYVPSLFSPSFFFPLPPMLPLPRGGRTAGLKRQVRGRGEEGKDAGSGRTRGGAEPASPGEDRAACSRLNCEPCSCPSNGDLLAGGVRAAHQPELMELAVDTEPQRPSTQFRLHEDQLTVCS